MRGQGNKTWRERISPRSESTGFAGVSRPIQRYERHVDRQVDAEETGESEKEEEVEGSEFAYEKKRRERECRGNIRAYSIVWHCDPALRDGPN